VVAVNSNTSFYLNAFTTVESFVKLITFDVEAALLKPIISSLL